MNKEQLETIKKGYQGWLEAENQADKNEFAECITTEDVPALIAEVERLRERVALDFFRCGETTTALAESVEENKRLREALEFYADESNHTEPRGKNIFGDIFYDKGKTARQALGDDDE